MTPTILTYSELLDKLKELEQYIKDLEAQLALQ